MNLPSWKAVGLRTGDVLELAPRALNVSVACQFCALLSYFITAYYLVTVVDTCCITRSHGYLLRKTCQHLLGSAWSHSSVDGRIAHDKQGPRVQVLVGLAFFIFSGSLLPLTVYLQIEAGLAIMHSAIFLGIHFKWL